MRKVATDGLETTLRSIALNLQEGRDLSTNTRVRLDLVVKHLVGDIVCLNLRPLLLQTFSDLIFHFREQVGVLLEDLDDLVCRQRS